MNLIDLRNMDEFNRFKKYGLNKNKVISNTRISWN